jgi:hypothetical protein
MRASLSALPERIIAAVGATSRQFAAALRRTRFRQACAIKNLRNATSVPTECHARETRFPLAADDKTSRVRYAGTFKNIFECFGG